jgi:hypothetical protein
MSRPVAGLDTAHTFALLVRMRCDWHWHGKRAAAALIEVLAVEARAGRRASPDVIATLLMLVAGRTSIRGTVASLPHLPEAARALDILRALDSRLHAS